MADVLHRTTLEYRLSVNTPDYDQTVWLANPDLSGVVGVPEYYWKLAGDVVSEMSTNEKAAVDELRMASAAAETHYEQATKSGRVERETWYRSEVGGTLKYKIREIIYEWKANVLLSETETHYSVSGATLSVATYDWVTVNNTLKQKKKR